MELSSRTCSTEMTNGSTVFTNSSCLTAPPLSAQASFDVLIAELCLDFFNATWMNTLGYRCSGHGVMHRILVPGRQPDCSIMHKFWPRLPRYPPIPRL